MLVDPRWDKQFEVANDEWRDVLRRAANLIERKGWTKFYFLCRDSAGRISGYCALGAINATRGGTVSKHLAEDKLSEFLTDDDVYPSIFVTNWNDRQTDEKVVIDAMRQAAKR